MNRISKQLLKIAREIISSEENSRKFQISGKDEQAKLFITLNSDDWKQVGRSSYWEQITDKFNKECQGNFYGIDHSCFKKKNLPLCLYKALALLAVKSTGYYNMYSHPWEYNEQAREKRWKIPGFVVRHAGAGQVNNLRELISYLDSRGGFITFSEWLSKRDS